MNVLKITQMLLGMIIAKCGILLQICLLIVVNFAIAVLLTQLCMALNEDNSPLWYEFETGVYTDANGCKYLATMWLLEEIRMDVVTRAIFATNHHILFLVPWFIVTVILLVDIGYLVWIYYLRRISSGSPRATECDGARDAENDCNQDPERENIGENGDRCISGEEGHITLITRLVWLLLSSAGIYFTPRELDREQW